ncbi:ABC transporter permease [Planctomycetaceae bacterium SH139]
MTTTLQDKPTIQTAQPSSIEAIASQHVTIIEARRPWQILDWRELVAYRDLFRFLIWRQIKVRYAQSAIGIGWAIIQPVFSMLLFTIIFGRLAQVGSEGAPYALFSFVALVPWTYFSNAVTDGVSSLVSEANMLRKVYFPRILMPLSAVVSKLVDFVIAMGCLAVLMVFYAYLPPWQVIFVPFLTLLMVVASSAISIWLTALAVQYRDVKHAMTFVIQLAMYASPVVYPTSLIPAQYQWLYALNPMVGVIEGFRASILGTQPMPWDLIAVGSLVSTVLLLTGLVFFRGKERTFADVA